MKTISFRTFEERDIDSVYRWKNDDELNKMSVGLNRKISHDDVAKWVHSKMPHNPFEVFWAVCTNDDDQRIIGYAGLTDIHYINSSAFFAGLMIGDKKYRDGIAWIELYQYVLEYAFERLGLNRLYGGAIVEHTQTNTMSKAMFFEKEGVERQAVFKNGRFYDMEKHALLKNDYFLHKNNGDYDFSKILKRLVKLSKETNNK